MSFNQNLIVEVPSFAYSVKYGGKIGYIVFSPGLC
jgi:hypothetical protein